MIIKLAHRSTFLKTLLSELLETPGGNGFHRVNRGLLNALSPEKHSSRVVAPGRATGSQKGNCVALRAFRLATP